MPKQNTTRLYSWIGPVDLPLNPMKIVLSFTIQFPLDYPFFLIAYFFVSTVLIEMLNPNLCVTFLMVCFD